MAEHIWTVLCRKGSVDKETNTLSLHDVLESITLDITPDGDTMPENIGVNLQHELISFFSIDSKTPWELKVEFIDPKGKVLIDIAQEVKITEEAATRYRHKTQISDLMVQTSGDYFFQVSTKEKGSSDFSVVAAIPLRVDIRKK